jgi:hypothetical protein
MVFYSWWASLTEKHMKFGELDIEDRLPFNPHFLRTLCINWMKDVLGLSDEEIAEAVGDTVEVVRSEYISKERVYDATPITDKIAEILQKREEEELGLKQQLKQEEEKHKAEVIVLKQEKADLKQAAEQPQKRVVTLEAEAAATLVSRLSDQAIIREQAGLISELATQISELNAKNGELTASLDAVKRKRVKVA